MLQEIISSATSSRRPHILYDSDGILRELRFMESCLRELRRDDGSFRIRHSLKANVCRPLLRWLASIGLGASVSNIAEFAIAREAGFRDICATAPALQEADLQELLDCGVDVYASSVGQLSAAPVGTRIGLRLQVAYKSQWDDQLNASRFGVEAHAKDVDSIIRERRLTVTSLLVHHRDIRDTTGLFYVAKLAAQAAESYPEIRSINLGGGMTALHKQPANALGSWRFVSSVFNNLPRNVRIYLEPGAQHLVANGYLVATIVEVIRDAGKQIVVLNASNWCLRGWSKPQLVRSVVPQGTFATDFVGPTCYEDDYWGRNVCTGRLEPGQFVIFDNCGSYITSMMRHFSQLEPPNETMIFPRETQSNDDSPHQAAPSSSEYSPSGATDR